MCQVQRLFVRKVHLKVTTLQIFANVGAGSTLNVKVIEKPQMLEINPSIWDGLSPDQAKKYYPEDWSRFVKDPYSYRAPRAESYHDLSGEHHPLRNFNYTGSHFSNQSA